MKRAPVPLLGLMSVLAALHSACGGDHECNSMYTPPVIEGSFEAVSPPFRDASELLICLDLRCDETVASRVSVRVASTGAPASFGAQEPPKPSTVTVSYNTQNPAMIEPTTGSVLRLRYPKAAEGPWRIDVSLRATVSPGTRCKPTTGTFSLEPR